jgi:Predicted integral membrane protein (DUF2269)
MSSLIAVSVQEAGKVTFYNLVLFVHISSAIVAFGVTFAYPIMVPALRPKDLSRAPWFHSVQARVGRLLITPAAVLILLSGLYIVWKGSYEIGDGFVGGGIAIIVIILGLGGAFFSRKEEQLVELAERDLAAGLGPDGKLSEDYERVNRQVATVGGFVNLLILVAVFLMVVKPGV